jgi:hypothetical protein
MGQTLFKIRTMQSARFIAKTWEKLPVLSSIGDAAARA